MELNQKYEIEINGNKKWFIRTEKGYLSEGVSLDGEVSLVTFVPDFFEKMLIDNGFDLKCFVGNENE